MSKREIRLMTLEDFNKKKPEIAKKENEKSTGQGDLRVKLKTKTPVKENNSHYYIQKRERLKEKKGKWGNWLNFKDYDDDKATRDEDLLVYIKQQTLGLQYRAIEKFAKGVGLKPEQKAVKDKGEGKFEIHVKEWDPLIKKLGNVKVHKRFNTPEERQSYFAGLTAEDKKGKMFKFKARII